MGRSITVSTCVDVDVDVDLDEFDEEDLVEELRARGTAITAETTPPEPHDRYVERAYLLAKQLPDCPQEFRDLLWHVHGRAI
jgi:hypothetical protein